MQLSKGFGHILKCPRSNPIPYGIFVSGAKKHLDPLRYISDRRQNTFPPCEVHFLIGAEGTLTLLKYTFGRPAALVGAAGAGSEKSTFKTSACSWICLAVFYSEKKTVSGSEARTCVSSCPIGCYRSRPNWTGGRRKTTFKGCVFENLVEGT